MDAGTGQPCFGHGLFIEREYWHHLANECAAISYGPGGAAGLKPLFDEPFLGSVKELNRLGAWVLTREAKPRANWSWH